MASPSTPPPMIPVPTRRRSLTGPLILIVIGMFFLLQTMHVVSGAMLWRWIGHWWPVLLIFWGVIRLAEYYADQRSGYPARRMGGGAIFLLIMVIFIGLAATKSRDVNWGEVRGNMDMDDSDMPWGNWFGQTYTFTNTTQQDIPANSSLRVLSDHGDVTVNVWDENKIKVDTNKKILADEGSDGNKLDSQTQPTVTVEGGVVTVNANTAGAGGKVDVRSDLQIWVPAGVPVDIATRKGDVTVQQRNANVKVSNSKGTITVGDIKGNVDLDERAKGDIHVARVDGTVTINGQVNDSQISEVSGDVKLTGDYYGNMQLSKLAKGFSFRSSRTEMEMAKLDGDLNMDPGDLQANGVSGPTRVVTKSTDIHLDGISGELHVENSNGNIEVHTSKLGPIDIANQTGDVHVVVPDKAGFLVDAHTRNGDVNTDFTGLRTENKNGDTHTTGSIGNGGPTIKVDSQHGDIELRKAGSDQG